MSGDNSEYFLNNKFTELTLGLENGLRIAVKQWGDENADTKILCLHGWLDNANSFDLLAPYLISTHKLSVRLVCMDFSGHGKSSHRSKDATYLLATRVLEVLDVVDELHWDKFTLLCHSMGAAVGLMVTGTVPDRINKLIMLDGIGPWPSRFDAAKNLRMAAAERKKLLHRQRRVYPSYEPAIERYLERNPHMKHESARTILLRSMEEVEVFEIQSEDGSEPTTKRETGLCFRHDPRLTGNSVVRYLEEDVLTFCRKIKCPVLVYFATNETRRMAKNSKSDFFSKVAFPTFCDRLASIKPSVTLLFVESSHHLHLDSAPEIYKSLIDFLVDPQSLPEYNNKQAFIDGKSKL